jgi:YidC/Oxa1 family membrane protein insertase
VALLLFIAAGLSGCSTAQGEVDLNAPPGWWEAVVVYPLAKLLMFLNRTLGSIGLPDSWGWAIIVLTIAIKVVTYPLTLRQLKSTRATQQLQPRLQELQAKYGKDRQKLAEEQTKLYQEAGINPLGGCLPLLVQLPILWGLYQSLYVLANPSVGELIGAGFLWIPDLSYPDLATGTTWINQAFSAQNWGKLGAYFSLPLIMILTQLALQKMSQPKSDPKNKAKDSQSRMMNQMMMFMPIMFGYVTLGLPSGLTLYWSVSNVLGIIQQYIVTGWGGLADWVPGLQRRETELVGVPASAPLPPAPPAAPQKTVKRRKRRK